MTAREMFEEQRYKRNEEDEEITYSQRFGSGYFRITFDLLKKEIAIDTNMENVIESDLLQAIIQQVKELHWFDEKTEIKQESNLEHYKDEIKGVDLMTKENYEDEIKFMYNFCISSNHPAQIKERFSQDLDFLTKLAKEHFEEKQETNLDHYKDDIAKLFIDKLALVNGKPERCENVTQCDGFCDLYEKCTEHKVQEELRKWLKQPYRKPTYKLTKFEYDLLNAYKNSGMRQCITNYSTLLELYEKGHIKDIDTSTPIHEILDNCEVIKDENC